MTPTQYPIRLASVCLLAVLAGTAAADDPAPAPTPDAATTTGLTLEAAVAKSLAIGEDVRIARARRDQAEAGIGKARAAMLPDLDATGTYTRRSGPVTRGEGTETVTVQTANALSGNITVSSTVFEPRAWPLLRAARRERDATAMDEKDQRRQTGFATAEAFLAALGQERIVQAATERRALAEARRSEVAARVEAQLTGSNDLTQADLELATAERELTAATGAMNEAYAQLAYWIGERVGGPLAEPTWLYDRAGAPATTTPSTAARPDLAAARLRVEVAAETAKEPARRIWPTIGVFGQVRFTNEPGLAGRNTDWSVGVTATWSIWDGGERAADARAAHAATEIARLEAASAERKATTEVDTAVVRLRAAQADVTAATTLAAAAVKNASEVTVLYKQGLVRALEVTDASSRRFEAEVAKVQATIGVAAAYLDVVAATGGNPVPDGDPK